MEGKYKYVILITTYNRYDKLVNFLTELEIQYKNTHLKEEVKIVLIDDCSTDERYKTLQQSFPEIIVLRNNINNGRVGYWKTVNNALEVIKTINYDHLMHLPDDMTLSKSFFKVIDDINLGENFFKLFQSEASYGKIGWFHKDWVDGAFISPRSFWDKVNHKIDAIPETRFRHKNISSGVWPQITEKLNKYKYKVISPEYSLLDHNGNEDSQMHPKFRLECPIHTYKFYDKI